MIEHLYAVGFDRLRGLTEYQSLPRLATVRGFWMRLEPESGMRRTWRFRTMAEIKRDGFFIVGG